MPFPLISLFPAATPRCLHFKEYNCCEHALKSWLLHIPFALGSFGGVHDLAVWLGFVDDHLLDEAIKYLADMSGSPAVEPEGVLVKVSLKVLLVNAALMRGAEPSF